MAYDDPSQRPRPQDRLQNLVDEIERADQVGLDVFGIGEHHRQEFLDSAPSVILGAAAAFALTRLLATMLYRVSPRDPFAFGSAFVVMTVASVAACLFPAWWATQTDPVTVLRD